MPFDCTFVLLFFVYWLQIASQRIFLTSFRTLRDWLWCYWQQNRLLLFFPFKLALIHKKTPRHSLHQFIFDLPSYIKVNLYCYYLLLGPGKWPSARYFYRVSSIYLTQLILVTMTSKVGKNSLKCSFASSILTTNYRTPLYCKFVIVV